MTAHSGAPATTAGEEASGGPWYRRRAWLVSGALVAVVAVAVIADRPQHSSRPGQISGDSRVMSQVNADVRPCSQALSKSFTILGDLTAHTLTPAQVNEVPGRLRQDQAACSLADASIYQLSTIDVPSSASGRDMGRVVSTVTLWATSDAVSAIDQIRALSSDPSDGTARSLLRHDEQLLAHDRALAESELGAAGAIVQAKLPALRLAQVPAPAS